MSCAELDSRWVDAVYGWLRAFSATCRPMRRIGCSTLSPTYPRTAAGLPPKRLSAASASRGACGFWARMRGMADSWGEHGLDLDAGELLYLGGRNEAAAYLNANGWNAVG